MLTSSLFNIKYPIWLLSIYTNNNVDPRGQNSVRNKTDATKKMSAKDRLNEKNNKYQEMQRSK